jgi:hypothetical protein
MIDGFWSGVFGGLLGPAISRWLGRYRFWKVFIVLLIGLYASLFFIGIAKVGLADSAKRIVAMVSTLPGILAPVGIAAALAFCAFLGATSAKKKE